MSVMATRMILRRCSTLAYLNNMRFVLSILLTFSALTSMAQVNAFVPAGGRAEKNDEPMEMVPQIEADSLTLQADTITFEPDSLTLSTRWHYDFVVPTNGNFVQAIHAANNRADKSRRFRIFIKSGNYRIRGEQNMIRATENGREIEFPSPMTILTAPNTSICGEDWRNTQVESMPMHEGISITSTLFVKSADSTYIQDIELWSNYRNDPTAFANRAVALNEKQCRGNILKNVSLLSNQDTYWTNDGGTTYLEDCTIRGTVDFICGGGTVYFNRCNLGLRTRGDAKKRDVIVAPSTADGLRYGYVFNSCRINGAQEQQGRYMLGRPWRNAPQAVFLNTIMELTPDSLGWTEMSTNFPRLFAEYGSVDGSLNPVSAYRRRTWYKDKDGRNVPIPFSPVLTDAEADAYDLDSVFTNWKPEVQCQQVVPPATVNINRQEMTWQDVPGAYCYAVCRDRNVVAFTRTPRYKIPRGTREGTVFTVRCANWYGGLGGASDEVYYSRLRQ